eukprot:s2549_g8.t1
MILLGLGRTKLNMVFLLQAAWFLPPGSAAMRRPRSCQAMWLSQTSPQSVHHEMLTQRTTTSDIFRRKTHVRSCRCYLELPLLRRTLRAVLVTEAGSPDEIASTSWEQACWRSRGEW